MTKDSMCVWARCHSRYFFGMLISPSVLLLKTGNLIMRMNEGNILLNMIRIYMNILLNEVLKYSVFVVFSSFCLDFLKIFFLC